MSWLQICGPLHPHPPCAFIACNGDTFTFGLISCNLKQIDIRNTVDPLVSTVILHNFAAKCTLQPTLFLLFQVFTCCAHIASSESLLPRCPNITGNVSEKDYSVLYSYLRGTGAHKFRDSVTLGFLGAYGHTPFDLGALPLAVANVNTNPDLLPGNGTT